ncbi:MAG: hypothetical protein P1U56_17435 [Saprospiraceae bacterium]|nr:hypothetical protein [Saprospiraceae bacterium]
MDEVKNHKTYPHIHLECHGSDYGICLKNNIRLTWDNLSELTTEINGLTGNNLVISMALCFGGHFTISLLNRLNASTVSRAPALAIIGPEKEISFGQLENGFSYFFDTFLTTRNLDKAVESLNINSKYKGKFIYQTCESMYKSLSEYFIKNSLKQKLSSNENLNKSIGELLRAYQNKTGKGATNKQLDLLKQKMLEKETYLGIIEDMRNTYFWIDKYPNNESRFGRMEISNWEEMVSTLK